METVFTDLCFSGIGLQGLGISYLRAHGASLLLDLKSRISGHLPLKSTSPVVQKTPDFVLVLGDGVEPCVYFIGIVIL